MSEVSQEHPDELQDGHEEQLQDRSQEGVPDSVLQQLQEDAGEELQASLQKTMWLAEGVSDIISEEMFQAEGNCIICSISIL